jgi:CubicO group peptidase (beta-lactamase class C family)
MILSLVSLSVSFAAPITAHASQTNATVTTSKDNATYPLTKDIAAKKATTLTSLYGVTSISYAVIDDGEIILSSQAGINRNDTKINLSSDTMYGIGSISKIFTTTAVMQLVEQGKVNLDTPVVTYIPEFTMADSRYVDITVRMLLNHSSGLMGSTLGNSLLFKDTDFNTYKTLLKTLSTSRLKANPGAYSVYCNDGFTLAELLVEKVSGLTFTDYINKNITTPLGIKNTKTPLDLFERVQLAGTYAPIYKFPLPFESLNMIGAGGIYSTAENLCRFSEIFMNRYSSNVLGISAAKTMEYPEYARGLWPKNGKSFTYGLGWDSVVTEPFNTYGIKALVKGGDTTQYHGSLIVLPEENISIALLSSGGSSSYNQIMGQEVLLTYLQETGRIDKLKEDTPTKLPVKAAMPASYKEYTGVYGTSGSLLKITISDDGTLTLGNDLYPNGPSQKFIYTGDGKFTYTDGSVSLSFEKDNNGSTYLYCDGYTLLPGIGKHLTSDYEAQKLSDNNISPELKKIWQERSNKQYFIVSEKYSSQVYALSSSISNIKLSNSIEGYWMDAKIIDKNNAKALIQIPGLYGRDLKDYTFFKQNKIEYLKVADYVFIAEDNIKALPAKTKSYQLNTEGYATWYKIDKKTAGKQIRLITPEKVAIGVYDKNNVCISYSLVNKDNTVTLPAEGYVVFAGEASSSYIVKFLH